MKKGKSQLDTLVEVATSEFAEPDSRDSAGKMIKNNYSLKISVRIRRLINKIKKILTGNKKL